MAEEKKMNETEYSQLVKELVAVGEMIRTHQDEKQAALDGFDSETDRFRRGKISQKALSSSVKKVNAELARLDILIETDIKKVGSLASKVKVFASRQSPKNLKATMAGIK